MLTPFGKTLRKLRIDRGLLLKEMADGVKVTSSFLSSVESGRKPIPGDLIARINAWCKLTSKEVAELERASTQSQKHVTIALNSAMSNADREAVALLARFEDLSAARRRKILDVLRGEDER